MRLVWPDFRPALIFVIRTSYVYIQCLTECYIHREKERKFCVDILWCVLLVNFSVRIEMSIFGCRCPVDS